MKTRKIIIIWVVLLLALLLPSCAKEDKVIATPAIEVPENIEGSVFHAGNVSAFIPKGWLVVGADPSMDTYGEDEARNDIYMYKGEPDADDLTSPGVEIEYFAPGNKMVKTPKEHFNGVEAIVPIELVNYTWSGYRAVNFGAPLVVLFANEEDQELEQLQVIVWLKRGIQEVRMEDPEVLAILSSIKARQ
ncbi:MAG TPA: hypothetical protein GX733_03240 [Tissierellia bacterium]|jgi:hypothetical protein|nr:hypothetical protein [Tissierellia bacterium]